MTDQSTASCALGDNLDKLGLSDLLQEIRQPTIGIANQDKVHHIALHEISPNPHQPRKQYDAIALDELASSIQQQGILHPLLVRRLATGYELIAGQRRLAAAKQVGLKQVPVLIKNIADETAMIIALIENTQRESLNGMDLAYAYEKLMQTSKMTQESLAAVMGHSRSHVSNILRLMKLPQYMQQAIVNGDLSMGHAKALLAIPCHQKRQQLYKKVIDRQLSVRQLETLIQGLSEPKKLRPEPDTKLLKRAMMVQSALHASHVQIQKQSNGKGFFRIEFDNEKVYRRLEKLLLSLSS